MNALVIGSEKSAVISEIVNDLQEPYLLIHDGSTNVTLPKRRKVTHFDVDKHALDFLRVINYIRAQDFVSVIQKAIPGGPNTLTKYYSETAMLAWLLNDPKSFYDFPRASRDVLGSADAENKITRMLLSPVLSRVLTNPTNFSLKGIVLVRLNRAELGDFDCLILGNLLASMYEHQVVIPDYGFYGHNTSLIREERLIAGVNYLSESELKDDLLLIPNKIASRCLPKDAEELAQYAGIAPHTNEWVDFIARSIE